MIKKQTIFIVILLFICVSASPHPLDTLGGLLREVEIVTKYNPAIPIIKKTIQNRNENGQFSNHNFSYVSYQKMIFTSDLGKDTTLINKIEQITNDLASDSASLSNNDSSYLKTADFFEKNHLYFMETVTKNYFKKPAKTYEKVIAHRTAGLKNPIASIFLAKQQDINFYQSDFITILEKSYVNPISKGALAIYDFRLIKKTILENDTTAVISFKPQKNANFASLAGTIWISCDNFAIKKIEAEPFPKPSEHTFSIKQIFEKQLNNTYFLIEMSLKVEFRRMGVGVSSGGVFVRPFFLTEKRISEIDYETRLKNREFGLMTLDDELATEHEQEVLLETYRSEPLTTKEANTILLIDSITKSFKVDKRLESLKILLSGRWPVSFISFDLTQIINFNTVEIARLGLGVYTNDRLSKVVNVGAFFGYGFKDKTFKWGSELGINLIRSRDFKVRLQYYSNLMEDGGSPFYDKAYTISLDDYFRSWLIRQFYRSNALGVTVQSRVNRWLTAYASTFYSANKTVHNYSFQQPYPNQTLAPYSFDDFYIKVGARLAFRESYWGADRFYFNTPSPFPVFTVQYARGIKGVINSGFSYNKVDVKMSYKKSWKILGFTNITLLAGFIDRALPASLLFSQRINDFPVQAYGTDFFDAMKPNEFLSDKYVALFLRHNFGKMSQNKKFSPRIIVCQGIGFGGLQSPNSHVGLNFKTMEKGYFESGVVVNDLLVIKNLLSFGVGIFIRYGAYYLQKPQYKTIDNFAFKATFRVPFDRLF